MVIERVYERAGLVYGHIARLQIQLAIERAKTKRLEETIAALEAESE